MDVVELIGRLAFAAIFVSSGPNHLLKREQMTAYARSAGAAAAPLFVPLTGLMIIAGGLLVAIGAWVDLGAALIVAFLIPTSFFMHGFWRYDDPMERQNQQIHFMKNVAMIGGALVLIYLFVQFSDQVGLTLTGPLF